MVEAIPTLTTKKSIKLFESFGVFTKAELESRVEVEFEAYAKAINIEAKTMIDMTGKQIIPAIISYTSELAESLASVQAACPEADTSTQKEILIDCSKLLAETKDALKELMKKTDHAASISDVKKCATDYHDKVVPAMAALRAPVDKLEMMVDKEYWPMPSYGDLIFEV
jgi:glutamine synthetase